MYNQYEISLWLVHPNYARYNRENGYLMIGGENPQTLVIHIVCVSGVV